MASSSKSKRSTRKQQSEPMQQERDWLELPADVVSNILCRIGVFDLLENAQKVCTDWHKICKSPAMWRVIHMKCAGLRFKAYKEMCKHAVDRSQGQLVDITIVGFLDDELLLYVADRSSQLRRLEIAYGFLDMSESLTKALTKFPLLEELSLYATTISKEAIETAGRHCPILKTLRLNQERTMLFKPCSLRKYETKLQICNMKAMAIGENFPQLRHLELFASRLMDTGLQAILDGCLHLESLDLRRCLRVDLNGDLGKRCSEHIKDLKLPNDPLEDYPYEFEDVSDGEYLSEYENAYEYAYAYHSDSEDLSY